MMPGEKETQRMPERLGIRPLTAERSDGSVDRLDKDTLVGDLLSWETPGQKETVVWMQAHHRPLTSSSELASRRIHPSSMTSAESLVT